MYESVPPTRDELQKQDRESSNNWILDLGASKSVTGDASLLDRITPPLHPIPIDTADVCSIKATAISWVLLSNQNGGKNQLT